MNENNNSNNDSKNNPNDNKNKNNRDVTYEVEGLKYFYFDLSEKNHQIILPSEKESAWEKLHDITWDPGRGD